MSLTGNALAGRGIEVNPLGQFDSDPVATSFSRLGSSGECGMQRLVKFWAWLRGCFDPKERVLRQERRKARVMAEFLERNRRADSGDELHS